MKQQLLECGARAISPVSTLVNTIKHSGARPIYTGTGAFCVSNSSKAAVRFTTFDLVRSRRLPRDELTGKTTASGAMLAGLYAGIAESVTVLTPGENLKTKLIDSCGGTAAYNTTGQALSLMLTEGGIRGLYRGVVPVSLKQSANAVVRFTSYSYFLDSVSTALKEQDQPTSLAPAVAGGMAGIVTVYATMPFFFF